MSDDQVRCEWVSVSSETGLPGLSRAKAVKRLCVCVCACACVCVCVVIKNPTTPCICSTVSENKRLMINYKVV